MRRACIASLLRKATTQHAPTVAYIVPDEPAAGAPAGNRYSDAFWARVNRGVTGIVRLGAACCIGCGELLEAPTRIGPDNRTARDPFYSLDCIADSIADRDAIAFVFRHCAQILRLESR